MKLANFSDEVKEIVYSIEQRRNQGSQQETLKKYRAEARNYVDKAGSTLNERFKLISDLKRPDKDYIQSQRKEEYEREKQRAIQQQEEDKKAVEKSAKMQKEIQKELIQSRMNDLNLVRKQNLLDELRKVKGLKINKKRIDELTPKELDALTIEQLEKAKDAHKKDEKEKEENFIKKTFKKADYLERARREEFRVVLQKKWEERSKNSQG
jgi:mRNA-degrading endonuclease RelE of RelBE toxin-antitoxin system